MIKRKTDTIALKKAMIDKGFPSISALAKASGVNRRTLGDILNGKVNPSAEGMERLSCALGLRPKEAGMIFFAEDLRTA